MFGCASLSGTDPSKLAMPLSFLYHHALAPPEWCAGPRPDRHVDMNMLPVEEIDTKQALAEMAPLVKGYLRLGAYFGNGAVVDTQFGTTDVLIIMPTDRIDKRYVSRWSRLLQLPVAS
jgi:putative hemolysin